MYCYTKKKLEAPTVRKIPMYSDANKPIDTPQPALEPLSFKSKGKMPLRTKKRLQEEKEYILLKGRMRTEEREKGNWKCFFCGNRFRVDAHPDIHHLFGRENEHLLDRPNLVFVHRNCHAKYTHDSVHKISWYVEWLERIKDSRPVLYEKELIKYNK